jgi:cyanobactin maturation PatA/PatG family protease
MTRVRTIAGVEELWQRTRGDPRVCIVVLDGPVDLTHPCFAGADLERLDSHWTDGSQVIPEAVEHATHIISVLVGQPGSEVEGLAPRCRCINVPVIYDPDSMLEPISLVHAINVAFRAGADIIHVASCIPTRSGKIDDLVSRAIKACVDNNILVVAPAGNDEGECLCVPAAISGVLAVGAYNEEGKPARFSNWGGIYQTQGILAPGTDIEGASPGGGTSLHKGTSCAAPIVTGIAALLMSVQLQEGWGLDARMVHDAILDSASRSTDRDPEERRRALRGFLDVSGAVGKLFALATARAWSARRVRTGRRPGEPDRFAAGRL